MHTSKPAAAPFTLVSCVTRCALLCWQRLPAAGLRLLFKTRGSIYLIQLCATVRVRCAAILEVQAKKKKELNYYA